MLHPATRNQAIARLNGSRGICFFVSRRRFSSGGQTHSPGGRLFSDSGGVSLAQGGGGLTGHFRASVIPGRGSPLPMLRKRAASPRLAARRPRSRATSSRCARDVARYGARGRPDRVFFGAPAPKNTRCMPSAEKSSNSFRLCASLCLRVFVVKTVHPDPLLPAEMWVMESPPQRHTHLTCAKPVIISIETRIPVS